MQGVTTALVAFLLVCVVYPNLVKNRPQYYAAFFATCLIILLDAVGFAVSGSEHYGSFRVFAYVATAFLQVAALLMLFMSAGGLSLRELAGDIQGAVEVMRRGSDSKEIIIPLSGEMARLKQQRDAERAAASGRVSSRADEPERERIVINDPQVLPDPQPPAQKEPGGSIPLEP